MKRIVIIPVETPSYSRHTDVLNDREQEVEVHVNGRQVTLVPREGARPTNPYLVRFDQHELFAAIEEAEK